MQFLKLLALYLYKWDQSVDAWSFQKSFLYEYCSTNERVLFPLQTAKLVLDEYFNSSMSCESDPACALDTVPESDTGLLG